MKEVLLAGIRRITRACAGFGLGRIPIVRRLHAVISRALTPQGIVRIVSNGHILYVNSADTGVAPSLLSKGVYEPFETKLVSEYLSPGMCVLNVGANIGYYTVLAAGKVGPTGQVHAFEPEPKNFALLSRNVTTNGHTHVVLNQAALSDRRGEVMLFLDENNFGNPSLAAENVRSTGTSISVPTYTLDEYMVEHGIAHVDLLQMDTQGSEGLILAAGTRILAQERALLCMEFWPYGLEQVGTDPEALLVRLRDHGFRIRRINEGARELEEMSTEEILQICRSTKEGRGFVNLLADKGLRFKD